MAAGSASLETDGQLSGAEPFSKFSWTIEVVGCHFQLRLQTQKACTMGNGQQSLVGGPVQPVSTPKPSIP